jgi:hypothetical protein
MTAAQQLLDRARSTAAIAELEADPAQYARLVAAELPSDIEATDTYLAAALQAIDELATRVMRLRLDHALADDTAIPAPTRRVFATTIVGYIDNLGLLEDRVRDVATRAGATHPEQLVTAVLDAARSTLALHAALRSGVVALIHERAAAAEAAATKLEEPAPDVSPADLIELD